MMSDWVIVTPAISTPAGAVPRDGVAGLAVNARRKASAEAITGAGLWEAWS